MSKDADAILNALCTDMGVPVPVREHRFHDTRKWRFDFAWPAHKVAVEVEGGVWVRGRHTRGAGFVGDMEKYNEAGRLGWRVFRVQPHQLHSGYTVGLVRDAINSNGGDGNGKA